jgi:hypothetical protein
VTNGDVDKDSTAAASLVSELMTAGDDEDALASFRGKRMGQGPSVSVDQLRTARDVLLTLAATIEGGDEARWLALSEAAEQLGVREPRGYEADPESIQSDGEDMLPTQKPAASEPPTVARPRLGSAGLLPKTVAHASSDELGLAAETMAKREVPFAGRSMSAPVYAVLCASCGAFPKRVREIHAKFGIPNQQTRQALDDEWQRCFDEEPRLRELWDALFTQFRTWLIKYGHV